MTETLGDVQAAQTAESSAIQQLTTDIAVAIAAGKKADANLQAEIATLQAQVASGQPIDLTGVVAAANANTTAIQAADAAVNVAVANLNPPAATGSGPATTTAAAIPAHLTPEGGATSTGPGTPA